MNEIFENDSVITRAHNFYTTNKALIIWIAVIVLITIAIFLALNQISKSNNEKAAEIYNDWMLQEIETDDGKKISTDLFNELIASHKKTGYTKVALLNQASSDARNGLNVESLNKFLMLIELTDGFGGNDLFNKIARVNAARLLYADKKYDEECCAVVRVDLNLISDPEDLRQWCKERISRWKIPRYIFFIDSFPITPSGKIQKYKLQEKYSKLIST